MVCDLILFGIIAIDLTAFNYLKWNCSISVLSPKRTTSGFSFILYHSTYPDWTVQFSEKIVYQCRFIRVILILIRFYTQLFFCKIYHLSNLLIGDKIRLYLKYTQKVENK